MALVRCKQCGTEVATDAVACPKCGTPRPRGMSTGKVLALIFGGLGLVCFGTCFLGGLVSALKGGGATAAGAASSGPARTVEIRTLLGEYRDNELRADGAFKGHVIQTTGTVTDIRKDMLNDAYLVLSDGAAFEAVRVQCALGKAQAAKAASLSKGARVTIRGRVAGLMMDVLVRDCELVGP
ncbi:OB-fold protein [Cystobacter fuscus]|nr:zinc-ribbon domain-containing protein [Cystobacter fuscus]